MFDILNCIRFPDNDIEEDDILQLNMHYAIYVPLYDLLHDYWNIPLAKIPQELRFRVEKAVPNWDDIDISQDMRDFCLRPRRQQLIAYYDFNNDNYQEVLTYTSIKMFIRELNIMIAKNKSSGNDMASVAVGLRDCVVLPLEKILSGGGAGRNNTEPSWWADIYWYSQKTLPSIRGKANNDKDFMLALALDDASTKIKNILTIDGWMNCKGYELVMEAEAAENSAQVAKEAHVVADEERKAQEEALSQNQTASVTVAKAKVGRPPSIEKKANTVREIIETFEKVAGIKFKSNDLPGSAVDLLDACGRIEKEKTKKREVFGSSTTSFNACLKAAGYRFSAGRTPDDEKKYWTLLSVKTVELITPEVFTEVYRKTTP